MPAGPSEVRSLRSRAACWVLMLLVSLLRKNRSSPRWRNRLIIPTSATYLVTYARVSPSQVIRRLKHRSDVGGEGREAVDEVADRAGGDSVFHRQPEEVDQLLAGVAEEVRADDAVGLLVDQH